MIEMRCLKNVVIFWAFKKDCKDIQHENMEILQLEVFVTVKVQAEQTQTRH